MKMSTVFFPRTYSTRPRLPRKLGESVLVRNLGQGMTSPIKVSFLTNKKIESFAALSKVKSRAFRTSESADFSEVRVRKFWTLKTLRTRTQRVCLFTHLYSKEVNISQKNSEISIFSFLKSYYSLYKPHAQISTIVKTS
jgi:hypothetical protein